MSNLLKRLQVIQTAIDLGDEDVVALQAQRLPEETTELAQLLTQQQYARAAAWIAVYRQNNTMLTEFIDPEVSALRLELAAFENTLTALTTTKAEYERRIGEFNAAYLREVGPVLEKLLQQRVRQEEMHVAEQQEDEGLQQARNEYEEFHRQQQEQPEVISLSDDEKTELKKLYQRAAAKCHPDRLPDEQKDKGTAKFKEVQKAYQQQDIHLMRKLLAALQDSDWTLGSATISDKFTLRRRIDELRSTIATLDAEIDAILEDETWQLIASLATDGGSWDDYFFDVKADMEKQLVDE